MQWLHYLVWIAGKEDGVTKEVLDKVLSLRWHSGDDVRQVRTLEQAVHFDRTEQEIGVQANEKN